MKDKRKNACLHMEVFDNLGVPCPDEKEYEYVRTSLVKAERLAIAKNLVKLARELMHKAKP